MNAIRSSIHRQLFQPEDERVASIICITKIDGKRKKHPTYLAIALTAQHPFSVRIYTIKAEKEDSYRKKETWQLKDIRMVDGINPRRGSEDFIIQHNEKAFRMSASTVEEKDSFVLQLQKLCRKYVPFQMPEFVNVPLFIEENAADMELPEDIQDAHEDHFNEYQPISAKEEADFRKLLAACNFKIDETDLFHQKLTEQLHLLDGQNVQSIMVSENSVNQLLKIIDHSLKNEEKLQNELDKCDSMLATVRDSVELIEEKDSLCGVEKKNKEKLRRELEDFIQALDTVTDNHLRVLQDANISDPSSIARCSEAARAFNAFHRGRIARPLENMSAYKERAVVKESINLFVDRFMSHLTALFHNLNDLTDHQDHLIIPKQSQRFHALAPLSELISWLKGYAPHVYASAVDKYVQTTKILYRRLFDRFFDDVVGEVQRVGSDRKFNSSNLSKHSHDTTFADNHVEQAELTKLIETVLGELGPVVEMEQKFVVRFFHITADLLNVAETTSQGSGDSGSMGGKSLEKVLNEQVRGVMAPLFDSLIPHLDKFCKACCKQNPNNVLLLFVILSKKALAPSDAGSYFAVTFGSLTVLIKRQFDAYMESEAQMLSDVRISKRVRLGILPSLPRFSEFVRQTEKVFEGADRRTDLEKWYAHLYRAVCDGISKASVNPNSKSPSSVVRLENYHELYQILSELKISCLDAQRKAAKKEKDDNIDAYVRESLGRPLEKIQIFFDNVQLATQRGLKMDEVSYQQQFSRIELKKVISQYPAKEVKKGLEQLYKKVEKHLVDGSSLVQVVWRNMQDQFIKQIGSYQQLMADCYPSSRPELEFSIQDVLQFFSEIAQDH
ncbi:unnamed protein product, partial [Mesorhabditis spiculigera]